MNKQRKAFLIGVILTAFDFVTEINTLAKELKWLCCPDVNLYCGHNPWKNPDNGYLYTGGDSRCEKHTFACTMPFTEDQCFLESSSRNTCETCMEFIDDKSTSDMRDYTSTYSVVRALAILTFVLTLCKESYKAFLVFCIIFKDNLEWEKSIIDSTSIILIYVFRPSLWKQLLDFVDNSKTSGELEHFRRLLTNLFLEDVPSIATAIFVLRNFDDDDDGSSFYAYLSLFASAVFIAYTIYLIRQSDQAYATSTTTTREAGTGKESTTESNSGDVKSNVMEEGSL